MVRRIVVVRSLVIGIWLGAFGTPASAVIVFGPQGRNTSAPTGSLSSSGWQYEGQFGSFLGTAINPQYFITAQHLGGDVGDPFVYQGTTYTTTAKFDSPTSDLTLWRVDGTFSDYAPLYTGSDEFGKDLVVFGRGTQRGAEVVAAGQVRGWFWGATDNVQTWGTNTVSFIESVGGNVGDLVAFTFDQSGGANEAHLSAGDSGGGVFIQDPSDGLYKLAGINYAVAGPFSFTGNVNDPGFDAAIFDARGLWVLDVNNVYQPIPASEPAPFPGASYATRISTNLEFIAAVVPEPSGLTLALCGIVSLGLAGLRSRRRKPSSPRN